MRFHCGDYSYVHLVNESLPIPDFVSAVNKDEIQHIADS